MRLFEIGEAFDRIDALLIESHGEVTPEIDALLQEYGALEADKIDGYAMYIRSLEHEAEGFKAVATEFHAKRTARENAARRLKERLKLYMEQQGQPQVKGKLYTAALQKNGGQVPVIVDVPPERLPEAYQTVVITPNTEALRLALTTTNGKTLEGMAHLGEIGSHVRIR